MKCWKCEHDEFEERIIDFSEFDLITVHSQAFVCIYCHSPILDPIQMAVFQEKYALAKKVKNFLMKEGQPPFTIKNFN